jgi:hypothetical protein
VRLDQSTSNNNPPAKPGAFRLLTPQRDLIATGTTSILKALLNRRMSNVEFRTAEATKQLSTAAFSILRFAFAGLAGMWGKCKLQHLSN